MDRSAIAGLVALVLAAPASAQLAPPMVRSSRPIGAGPGETIALEVRGSDFRDGASLRFDDPRVQVGGVELAKGEGLRTLRGRVAIPAEVGPGPLRFRVVGQDGVSNPGQVWIGRPIATVAEVEPNNRLGRPQVVAGPVAIEGMIAPGDDVDVFGVEMKAGETLAAEVVAGRAGSRLDAYLTILSPDGRELAANDDLFGRDAAAWATVPADGRYLVAIQDAEGRHRDGGIEPKMTRPYRLEVGRLTLVTGAFPAGARRGQGATLRLLGANLPDGGSARFDPPMHAPLGDHAFAVAGPLGPSNALTMRVGDLDEVVEVEPNGMAAEAPVVLVPSSINGSLGKAEDVDIFRLKTEPGREGDYAITAFAARVGSPADPVLAALDAKGDPQAEDDDKLGRDARIERRVDSGEGLLVSIRDYYGRGGARFAYRIEAEPIGRGVTVAAELGHRTLPRGGAFLVPVVIERRGFDGPVTLLAEGLPDGVASMPVAIAPGDSTGWLAFAATIDAPLGAFSPKLVAREATPTFRFRGVGFSHYTGQITHHIGPDIDAERNLVIADLTSARMVQSFYQVSGIGPTFAGRNGGGDPYFTDGEVTIAVLTQGGARNPQPPLELANPPGITLKDAIWTAAEKALRQLPQTKDGRTDDETKNETR